MSPQEAQQRVKDGLGSFTLPRELREALRVLSHMRIIPTADDNSRDAERWRELMRGLAESGSETGKFERYIEKPLPGDERIGEAVPQTVEARVMFKRLPVLSLTVAWVDEGNQRTLTKCVDATIKRRADMVAAEVCK